MASAEPKGIGSENGRAHGRLQRLNALIHFENDLIAALRAAIERLSEPTDQQRLRAFVEDHEQHVRELSAQVVALGETPASGADATRLLTEGKVRLGGLSGDRPIFAAMRANEEYACAAYERALPNTAVDSPPAPLARYALDAIDAETSPLRALLVRLLADERRHLRWIERRLGIPARRERDSVSS